MAFFKLLGECLFIICHTVVKLFFRYIYIIYLDVELLSGRKRIAFFLYFIVRNSYGKIFYCLLALECADNLFYLVIVQMHLFQSVGILSLRRLRAIP